MSRKAVASAGRTDGIPVIASIVRMPSRRIGPHPRGVTGLARSPAKAGVDSGYVNQPGVTDVPAHPQHQQLAIVHGTGHFSHGDACRIADLVLGHGRASTVIIDLKNAVETTTSAFARLVILRRVLLKTGRDLLLTNLRDRAASLYQINRLGRVLPCA